MNLKKILFAGLVVQLLACDLWAGSQDYRINPEAPRPAADSRFERGRFELSLVSGALISPVDLGANFFPRTHTSFDYTQTELRLGLMLNSPWEAGILRGNFEFLVGLGGGTIVHGPGTVLANGDLFFRYNFVQPRARLVPYWQLGLGLLASDAARDSSQRLIGRTLEFLLQSGVGVRVLINPRWSLDVEAVYHHISNADTADRNVGVNALGGLLGLTYSL